MEFNPNKVKGFNKLNDEGKEIFLRVTPRFIAAQGIEYKKKRNPIKVSKIKGSNEKIRVDLADGRWQVFNKKGEWY